MKITQTSLKHGLKWGAGRATVCVVLLIAITYLLPNGRYFFINVISAWLFVSRSVLFFTKLFNINVSNKAYAIYKLKNFLLLEYYFLVKEFKDKKIGI